MASSRAGPAAVKDAGLHGRQLLAFWQLACYWVSRSGLWLWQVAHSLKATTMQMN